jgi:hypothetical protein
MGKETIEITREHVEQRVQMTEYFRIPNTTVTIASLHLASGYVVTGESSVVNPSNYDEARGREIARDKAIKKLAELEQFLAAERRYDYEATLAASGSD